MRWEALFTDLEAQLADAAADDDAGTSAERERAEVAAVHLRDRLRAAVGQHVGLRLLGGGAARGRVLAAGPDWVLLAEPGDEVLVPTAAVVVVDGLTRALAAPAGAVEGRLGLASVLRGVARDRTAVRLALVSDAVGVLTGTLDRVGADHLELALHPVDEPRRPGAVRGVAVVPLSAVAHLRRAARPDPLDGPT